MRGIKDIMDDAAAALRPFIIEAFEVGRKTGADETRAALEAFLHHPPSANEGIAPATDMPDEPTETAVLSEGRATPGSVKPAIMSLIVQSPGMTVADIQRHTGAKPNSVRGTLWTLQKEERIERRGHGFFPVEKKVSIPTEFGGKWRPRRYERRGRLTEEHRKGDMHHVAHGP